MNRTERLLDLITYLLNAKDPVSWRKIKNHFPDDYARGIEESNQRKFERDKAELISLGIPIDYQSTTEVQKEGYLIRKEKLFLPGIEFTPQESSLMMLSAGAVLENEDFPYREQLESALHKIISLQSQLNRAPDEIKITYSDPDRSSMQSGTINKVQDALDRRKTVRFTYHAFSTRETTKRSVDPYGMIYRKGKWTLIGYDHLRRDLRAFVVNRISDLEVNLKRPGTPDYDIPADFTLKVYQNQQPWELGLHEPVDVIIDVLSPHRMNELVPQLTGAESLGDCRFKLEVTNFAGLISWVLSQKSEVVVIEPSEVREQISDTLKALI